MEVGRVNERQGEGGEGRKEREGGRRLLQIAVPLVLALYHLPLVCECVHVNG